VNERFANHHPPRGCPPTPAAPVASGAMAAFDVAMNTQWMEALDIDSGRLYYIHLATHQTSWDCPEGFLVRSRLVDALASTLASGGAGGGEGEAAFLARVRERFPPPASPPPAASAAELDSLRAQLEALRVESDALSQNHAYVSEDVEVARREKARLEETVATLRATLRDAGLPDPTAPTSLAAVGKAPTWKRGVSHAPAPSPRRARAPHP
jgi:hypothetical protein